LAGKTALVTGAAKRIGREIALALADEGADIVIHFRSSADEAAELAAEVGARGAKSWAVKADFEKPEEYETLIERAVASAGSLDILVNSASVFGMEKLEDLTFESLMRNVEVNAWAPFVLARWFARLVGAGKIVNLLDSRIVGNDFSHAGYILSKRLLAALTEMLAVAYAPDIAVNAVAPGLILPPPGKDESYLERLRETVPLKRHGGAENVAEAVLFLVKSDFVTGEVVFVDGGRRLKEYPVG